MPSMRRTAFQGILQKDTAVDEIKEYLNHLNIALGSCGELYSCCESFKQAGQITTETFDELDKLHYKVENALINLIRTLQNKQKDGNWEDTFR